MSDSPRFVLSVAPHEPTRFVNLFGKSDARSLLEKPGTLRPAGWDMETQDQARIVRGEYLEVGITDWKTIRLYEDGTLVAIVPADETFLGWGSRLDAFWDKPRLNPLAIIEFVYSFAKLYSDLVVHLMPRPRSVRFRADLNKLFRENARVYLVPYGLDTMMWLSERIKHVAPDATMRRELDGNVAALVARPERIAYLLVERIYAWFGAPPEHIPYCIGDGEQRFIDIAALRAGGKRDG